MRRTIFFFAWIGAALLLGRCEAADWYQWRGPERNGVVAESPPLLDSFPATGLKAVWKSEKVLGYEQGGYGSVTVAGGLVYVYSNGKYREPIETRKLTAQALDGLGWSAEMPEDLRKKVEEVRVSEAREKLDNKAVGNWAREWTRANVPQEQRKFGGICQRRLSEGKKAMPIETLAKLEAIKDKEFPNPKELDEWFAGNGIEEPWKKVILRAIPTFKPYAHDEFFCFDAADGRTVWKERGPGRHYEHSCSSTPCVVDGRCYVHGSDGMAYCLDAKTGKEIWKVKSKGNPGSYQASSFVVEDGVAVLLAGPLTGFDAQTGAILWTTPQVKGEYPSAAYWRKDGKTYLVCSGERETFCFEAKTGKVLWKVPGGGWSTPAIEGDFMALYTNNSQVGLAAYKLSLEGGTKLWSMPAFVDRGASPVVYAGHVYALGGQSKAKAMCVELETGKVAWEAKLPNTEIASPVVADGKIWIVVGSSLYAIRATPEKYELLGEAKLPLVVCTTPALVDGRAYVRLKDALACYDLRK